MYFAIIVLLFAVSCFVVAHTARVLVDTAYQLWQLNNIRSGVYNA